MDSPRDLYPNIMSNRLDWLAASGCGLIQIKQGVACFHPDRDDLNAVLNINCEWDVEATAVVQAATALIEYYSQRRAAVWVSPYCRPTSLPDVLTGLGLRVTSVSFTLIAEPETVKATAIRDLLIWEVSSGSRPSTVDAYVDTYQHAFERSITAREVNRWKETLNAQGARFFVGFRKAPTLGGPLPGQAAVVGQLVPSHGIGGIYGIGTVPMLRGHGYAPAMIAHIANKAAEAGLPHVYATTRELANCRIFEGVGLQEKSYIQVWR